MKFLLVEEIGTEQIMLVQDEFDNSYFACVQSVQNYAFSPSFISKRFKTKKAAKSAFEKLVIKYKGRIL